MWLFGALRIVKGEIGTDKSLRQLGANIDYGTMRGGVEIQYKVSGKNVMRGAMYRGV